VDVYRNVAGADPPYPAAQAFAAGLTAARCAHEAGSTSDDDLRVMAMALDVTTMFGRFRLDPATGDQVGHCVLAVQRQGGGAA
jgi:branched-chain amino acid transport system substrate-binding protein